MNVSALAGEYQYLLASPVSWRRRLVHLGVTTMVLLVVSFSWAVAVDRTPADQRPYVGSSSNNSESDLIFGYNGLGRLTGQMLPGGEMSMPEAPPGGGPGGGGENGEPGPLRLLDEQLAGQIGWLLPLAVVGLLAASWQNRPRLPIDQQPPQGLPLWRRWFLRVVSFFKNLPQLSLDKRQGALVLWGMWLVTMVGFFSVAGFFHRYYLMMLGPGIAALVGAGAMTLWRDYHSSGWRGWLLPLTLLGTAALQAYIILSYYDEGWGNWLTLAIVGLCVVAAVGLIALRLKPRLNVGNYSAGAVVVGMLALLIAPTVWATYTVWHSSVMLPVAGPQTVQGAFGPGGGGPPGGGPGGAGPPVPGARPDPALIDYLQANRGGAEYLVASNNSMSAAPIILNTDEAVIDLGGFGGFDQVLSIDELSKMVDKGAVRFFLVPDIEGMEEMFSEMMAENPSDDDAFGGEPGSAPQGPPPGGPPGMDNEAVSWVRDNCEQVPQEEWQSPVAEATGGPMGRIQLLYDCGTTGDS